MARKQITIVVDDLTGEESVDAKAVTFALEGVTYEIDLSEDNARRLAAALAPYIAVARKTSSRTRAARGRSSSNASEIREWAISEGIDVPQRGRIPASLVEQYEAAH